MFGSMFGYAQVSFSQILAPTASGAGVAKVEVIRNGIGVAVLWLDG